ncbi:MAG: hypothetical protein JXA78_01195 [Anaerolineales bacterium]|nr:hypothetical protein [Anaerolineales bacterium]
MNIGMLWFDNDPKVNLDMKVERAATYYRNKYGKAPTLCFIHPSMMPAGAQPPKNGNSADHEFQSEPGERYLSGGVEIRGNRSVLPNHFWIGVNGAAERK